MRFHVLMDKQPFGGPIVGASIVLSDFSFLLVVALGRAFTVAVLFADPFNVARTIGVVMAVDDHGIAS